VVLWGFSVDYHYEASMVMFINGKKSNNFEVWSVDGLFCSYQFIDGNKIYKKKCVHVYNIYIVYKIIKTCLA